MNINITVVFRTARKSTVLSQKSLFLPPLLVTQARPPGSTALSVTEGSAAKRYLVAKERCAVMHRFLLIGSAEYCCSLNSSRL